MSRIFDVRVGDIFAFTTNNGIIEREITIIGHKRIGYINNGKERACLKTTFKRWWRSAELIYTKDWDGRE